MIEKLLIIGILPRRLIRRSVQRRLLSVLVHQLVGPFSHVIISNGHRRSMRRTSSALILQPRKVEQVADGRIGTAGARNVVGIKGHGVREVATTVAVLLVLGLRGQ